MTNTLQIQRPQCPDDHSLRFDDWEGTFESSMHEGAVLLDQPSQTACRGWCGEGALWCVGDGGFIKGLVHSDQLPSVCMCTATLAGNDVQEDVKVVAKFIYNYSGTYGEATISTSMVSR
jgi:hypothetical protein